jgi:myo-inositol-1(or 4)-monophosphatase
MPAELQKRIDAAKGILPTHLAYFVQNLGKVESHWKYDHSRVTAADLALSRSILGRLAELFPEDDTVSEEDLPAEGTPPRRLKKRFCWVLDPIDGTNNYAAGLASCGIMLALLEDGLPAYGWIYDHFAKQIVEGGPGRDLLVDGHPFTPPPQSPDFGEYEFVTCHFPIPQDSFDRIAPILMRNNCRSLGSAASHLSRNALGVFAGSISLRGKIWDFSAPYAVLAAAGRQLVFLKNDPFPFREITSRPSDLPNLAGTKAFLRHALPLFDGYARP